MTGQDSSPAHDRDQARRIAEASAWLAAVDAGTADSAAFEAWRGADPRNAVAFARVAATWKGLEGHEAAPLTAPPRRRLLRAAAIGLPVLLAGGGGLVAQRAYAWTTAETGIGTTRQVALPDGSSARLNTDSSISWRFRRDAREMRINRGEVAIDLKPGAAATLLGSDGRLVALQPGRVNARLFEDRLELTVLRGNARALAEAPGPNAPGAPHAGTDAAAYQRMTIAGDTVRVARIGREQVAATLAWQQGEILLHETRLADAVAEFNRYLPTKIVIADPALADTRIGGRFAATDAEGFLRAAALGLGLRARRDRDQYTLEPR